MNQNPASASDRLTPTQSRVLSLARRGLTNNEIAATIGISRNAVRFHLKNLHASLETGGDRDALIETSRTRGGKALALLPALLTPQVAAAVAAAALSVGGILGLRAIQDLNADPSLLAAESKANDARDGLFCLGKMEQASGRVAEELCFRSESEALNHLGSAGQTRAR